MHNRALKGKLFKRINQKVNLLNLASFQNDIYKSLMQRVIKKQTLRSKLQKESFNSSCWCLVNSLVDLAFSWAVISFFMAFFLLSLSRESLAGFLSTLPRFCLPTRMPSEIVSFLLFTSARSSQAFEV